jgi:hypothetical protein
MSAASSLSATDSPPQLYILQYLTPDMLLTFTGQQDAYLLGE